jgi:oxygen-dependent protoporphyrinogen oxidase
MIAIIGGGISGLSLAYYLQKTNQDYILFEKNENTGGYIQTVHHANAVLEKGPNSILADEFVFQFLKELGLENDIVRANDVSKNRFVLKDKTYQVLPSGPGSLLMTSFFSTQSKWKIFSEPFKKQSLKPNATVYEMIENRFGQQVADYALDPFISGIYAGNAKELLAELCFPTLVQAVKEHGSIIKGMMKNPPVRKTSITFQKGLSQVISSLTQALTNIKFSTQVEALNKLNNAWEVVTNQGVFEVKQVVLALPAYEASTLFKNIQPVFSNALAKANYPMVWNMHIVVKKTQLGKSFNGFGALHPSQENTLTAGVIWNSSVFDNRTNPDELLFTCMVTEKRTPKVKGMTEQEVKKHVLTEFTSLYELKGDPIHTELACWPHAIPQYDAHMKTILEQCREIEKMNVYICSNWPMGISITDCIHKAHDLAYKLKS